MKAKHFGPQGEITVVSVHGAVLMQYRSWLVTPRYLIPGQAL